MKLLLLISLLSSSFMCFAEDSVSNADLNRKLDLILQKVDGLEERVSQLESDNALVKQEVEEVAKSAKEAKTATKSLQIPQDEKEKKSFLNKLRIDLKSEEVKAKGPWSNSETWDLMKKNMTRFQVRKLLGNPNMIKGNLSPRIDQVYHYHGDLDADGEEEKGTVNFYRDRVVSFSSPFE